MRDLGTKYAFGKNKNGEEVSKYVIGNGCDMQVTFTDLGAAVTSILLRDKKGEEYEVALSYDDPLLYESETTYFGAVVAPYANRIAEGKFEIDGVSYELDINNGPNNLHSGCNGLAKKIWKVTEHTNEKIVFAFQVKDMEFGFPGNVEYQVSYEVTADRELVISYLALPDKKTAINITNHTYFNLNGATTGSVEKHTLWIKADAFTPVRDANAIPTGEDMPVEGTPFDFRVAKEIGRDIENDFEQLNFGQGYDHNFVLAKETDGLEKIATVWGDISGIQMDVWTDCIGVQLYTGNFLNGDLGPDGHHYVRRGGLCLETQYYPNSINEPNFVTPVTEAGCKYESKTIYAFCME
ncbi:MAG: galactose mutarotase [Agathobacter sp.]|nr:galactose mutarotase [Agathobacter sp.]